MLHACNLLLFRLCFQTASPQESRTMNNRGLSYNSRKALMVNIGENAGSEVADLLSQLMDEVEELRRTKVSITRIVPGQADRVREFIEEPV